MLKLRSIYCKARDGIFYSVIQMVQDENYIYNK